MEQGTILDITTLRTPPEILEETTVFENKETVATTVKRVYLTPKLVFNNKVELSTTITPYQKTSQMNTITTTSELDEYSLQDLNENTLFTKVSSKTMKDVEQNNLLSKTASTMVETTTSDNIIVDKNDTYDIKTIFPTTSRAPMSGAESSSADSRMPSGSSEFTTFLTEEVLPENDSSTDDSKV